MIDAELIQVENEVNGTPIDGYDPVTTIYGDDDLEQQALAMGWEGTGTISDPIIVEGLNIDGDDGDYCISIFKTNLSFEIRNSTFHNATSINNPYSYGYGILIRECSNITFVNCTSKDNMRGCQITGSDNISFEQSSFQENTQGNLFSFNSNDVSVKGCNSTKSQTNVYFSGGKGAIFSDCYFETAHGSNFDIWYSSDFTIEGCTYVNGDYSRFTNANDFVLRDCSFENTRVLLSAYPTTILTGNVYQDSTLEISNYKGTHLWENRFFNGGIRLYVSTTEFDKIEIPINNTVNGHPVLFEYDIDYDNGTIPGNWGQYILGNVSNLIFDGLEMDGSGFPITLIKGNHVIIDDARLSNATNCISAGYCKDLIISNSTLFDIMERAIHVESSENVIIRGNDIARSTIGISVSSYSTSSIVFNNHIQECMYGIEMGGGLLNVVARGNVLESNSWGIYFFHNTRWGNRITENYVRNSTNIGIHMHDVSGTHLISENIVSGTLDTGIEARLSFDIMISGNIITDSGMRSIFLNNSGRCKLYSNEVGNIGITLRVTSSDDLNTIPKNNTVNSMPIHHVTGNGEGRTIPDTAGQIIVDYCNGLTIEDLEFNNISYPIVVSKSNSLTIKNCEFNDCGRGSIILPDLSSVVIEYNNFTRGVRGIEIINVYSWMEKNLQIQFNNFTSLTDRAVRIYNVKGAWIEGNRILDSGKGMIINWCNNCTVKENLFLDLSGVGLLLDNANYFRIMESNFISCGIGVHETFESNNNLYTFNMFKDCTGPAIIIDDLCYKARLYNNAFIGNNGTGSSLTVGRPQVRDLFGQGKWYHPDGTGNYWHDLTSPDDDEDGRVDIPYNILNDRTDDYPLTEIPFTLASPPTLPYAIGGKGFIEVGWGIPEDTRMMPVTCYTIFRYNETGEDEVTKEVDGDIHIFRDFSMLDDIPYTYYIQARTGLGTGEMTGPLTAASDGTPPIVNITSPISGMVTNETSVIVVWESSDPFSGSGIATASVALDGGVKLEVEPVGSLDLVGLTAGNHTVEIEVVDNVGNPVQASTTFTVDLDLPEIEIILPVNGTIFNKDSVNVQWNGTDNTSMIRNHSIRLDGGKWVEVRTNVSRILTNLSEGPHRFDVMARDLGGNFNVTTVHFIVDTISPSLNIAKIENGSYHKIGRVLINWSASDAGTGMEKVSLYIDDVLDTEFLRMEELYIEGLIDGEHSIKLVAMDIAGNSESITITVFVDTLPPHVLEYHPVGDGITSEIIVSVMFSEEMDWDAMTLVFQGVPVTFDVFENDISYHPPYGLDMGLEYVVSITGTDLAGNPISFQWNFSTDKVGTIRGQVVSEDGDPIEGVSVILNGNKISLTDQNGFYRFNLTMGSYQIDISMDGYYSKTIHIDVSAGTTSDAGQTTLVRTQEDDNDSGDKGMGFIPILAVIIMVLIIVIVLIVIFTRRTKGSIEEGPSVFSKAEQMRHTAQESGVDIDDIEADYRNALYQRDIGDMEDSVHSMETYLISLEDLIEGTEEW